MFSEMNLEKFKELCKILFEAGCKTEISTSLSVLYAIREKVERELDRLQANGVIKPVQFSDWAAPIIPVVKKDRSVCIGGDIN